MDTTLQPLVVKRSEAARLLSCGPTKVWELQKRGELETIKLDSDDRITVDSIRRYIQRRMRAAA